MTDTYCCVSPAGFSCKTQQYQRLCTQPHIALELHWWPARLRLPTLSSHLQVLNWNSHHIDDYILEVMTLVKDVNETLATIKGNVKRTSEVLAGWGANPMFDRREGKVRPMHTKSSQSL